MAERISPDFIGSLSKPTLVATYASSGEKKNFALEIDTKDLERGDVVEVKNLPASAAELSAARLEFDVGTSQTYSTSDPLLIER